MLTNEAEVFCRLIDQRAKDQRVFDELTKEPPQKTRVEWLVGLVVFHGGDVWRRLNGQSSMCETETTLSS